MTKGCKTGGRAPGTPNRRTADIERRLRQLACDPIEGMARIAADESVDPGIRGRMYSELAQYVYPKRKAIEIEATVNSQPTFIESLAALHREAGRRIAEKEEAERRQAELIIPLELQGVS